MTRLAICRSCGNLVRLDEPLCSACGHRRPEGGWLAEPAPAPRVRSKKGMIALGIIAAVAAVGIVPLRGSHSVLGMDHRWVPQVGKAAKLGKNSVLCPSHALLEDLGAAMFRASGRGHPWIGRTSGKIHGAAGHGCFANGAPATVTVLDLRGLSFPTARVRLRNGDAYWVRRSALTAPAKQATESQAPAAVPVR